MRHKYLFLFFKPRFYCLDNNLSVWRTLKIILNTGKLGVFTFVFKIQILKNWLKKSLQQAGKIVAADGEKRMKEPRYYYPGEKPYRMIYTEDPFGNILEIYNHSYELTYGAGAY